MAGPRDADERAVADELRRARRVLVVTGAGMSADAGLPTYRGIGGLYEGTDTEDGVPIEVALSGAMLRTNPALCWKHVARIEAACRGAEPHPGHRMLAALEADREVVVLTQNVDGLHQAAGSTDVIEIHGDVHRLACTRCGWRARVPSYADLAPVPSCPDCGALVRPEVVLFGEALPEAAVRRLTRALSRPFDLVFLIGTTAVFPYIAAPVIAQARAGRPTVEIDPGETRVSRLVRWKLRSGAADTLVALAP